jgi:hypothetical protein
MTTVANAVEALHRAGYQANASAIYPGRVTVLDPVACSSGQRRWTEFERRNIHASEVWKFINDRS